MVLMIGQSNNFALFFVVSQTMSPTINFVPRAVSLSQGNGPGNEVDRQLKTGDVYYLITILLS